MNSTHTQRRIPMCCCSRLPGIPLAKRRVELSSRVWRPRSGNMVEGQAGGLRQLPGRPDPPAQVCDCPPPAVQPMSRGQWGTAVLEKSTCMDHVQARAQTQSYDYRVSTYEDTLYKWYMWMHAEFRPVLSCVLSFCGEGETLGERERECDRER